MDKAAVHHRGSLKQANSRKKPIKVVYISTPMKVKTSVSKFRDLVQGLTGRDSTLADVERILAIDTEDEPRRGPDHEAEVTDDEPSPVRPVLTAEHERESPSSASAGSPFDLFDDVFTPEMLESFIGSSPSSLLLEPQADIFRGLDVA